LSSLTEFFFACFLILGFPAKDNSTLLRDPLIIESQSEGLIPSTLASKIMKAQILLLFPWVGVILAGPVRRDCGKSKSFVGTNSCGETYGGEWIECATGISAIPTFVMPTCTPTPTSATEHSTWVDGLEGHGTVTASPESMITSGPMSYNLSATPIWPNATSSCTPLFICVDCLAVCGGVSRKYGDCYDACTSHSISSPECTLPSATLTTPDPVTLAGASTTGTISKFNITAPAIGLYEAPVREEKAWCLGASFMCRPKGWGRRRG